MYVARVTFPILMTIPVMLATPPVPLVHLGLSTPSAQPARLAASLILANAPPAPVTAMNIFPAPAVRPVTQPALHVWVVAATNASLVRSQHPSTSNILAMRPAPVALSKLQLLLVRNAHPIAILARMLTLARNVPSGLI